MQKLVKPKHGYKIVKNYFKKEIEIPDNWNSVKYKDILIEVEDPVTFDDNTEYKLITIKRRNGGLVLREILKGKDILTKDLYSIEPGDFVIAKMQIIHGACGLVPESLSDAKISGSYLRFKAKEILDLQYLNWFSHTPMFYQQTFVSSVGSNLEKMNFNKKHWLNHSIPLPPFREQQKIASILSNVDSLINQTQKIIEQTQRLKKGLMQRLLTRGIGHPKFKNVSTKFGRNDEIPESWNFTKLGNVLQLEYGEGLVEEKRSNSGYAVYGSGGLIGYHKEFLKKGPGIIVARKGSLGNVFFVLDSFWAIDTVYYITKEQTTEDLHFLFYLLQHIHLENYAIVTAQPGISREEVYTIYVKIPPISEQQKIASILSNVDFQIQKQQEYKSKLETLKKGLMQKLLTGQIRVNA